MSVTPENALGPDLAVKAALSRVIYGSCLCGDVGYRISGSPLRMVICDCESCRLARGAACASNLFVPVRQFRWTRGESQVVSYRLPGPTAFATAFCRRCGGDLPRASRGESVVVVPAGSLDGDPGVRPQQAHVGDSEKASWLETRDGLPQYAEMPPVV
ncbi:MAG: GFA family protein [Gammaproteobacteria bacterium]